VLKSIGKQLFYIWLRYNYFQFLKTNVRHVGIVRPVYTLITSACYTLPMSPKSDYHWRKYDDDVMSIFKMVAVTHAEFAVG